MAGIVTLKSQCVKLRPCAFVRAGPEHVHARYLPLMTKQSNVLKEEASPKGILDNDRFG